MKELPRPARLYILGVGFGGVALGAAFARNAFPVARPWVCLVFVLLTILGELRHVEAPVGGDGIELTFSTAFAFTLLISFGIPFAAIAAVLASAIADALGRKPWWKAPSEPRAETTLAAHRGAVEPGVRLGRPLDDRHVDEAGQVQLSGHGDRVRRAVPVLGDDEVGLARAG